MKTKTRNHKVGPYKIKKLSVIKKKIIFFDNTRMVDVTRKNCYKCDLQTIIDPNDSQYFWVNLKDFEVEAEHNWRNIFNKHGNSSTLIYI